jgi:hypothetical protein
VSAELVEKVGRLVADALERLRDLLALTEPALCFVASRPEQPAEFLGEVFDLTFRVGRHLISFGGKGKLPLRQHCNVIRAYIEMQPADDGSFIVFSIGGRLFRIVGALGQPKLSPYA